MSKISPAYLLLGPEKGQKDDFIREVRQELQKSSSGQLEESKHYAFETDIAALVSDLQNGSLFSSTKLVLLVGVEEVKKKGDLDLLKDYLKTPSEDAVLLLVSDETKVDEPLKKAVEKLSKEGVKIFWEMYESQKKGWLINHFRTLGMTLGQEEADFLLEMVENSTDQLRSEGEKLLSFYGPGRTLSLEDLETYISHSKEESVFTLFEAAVSGEFEQTVEVLQKILLSQDRDAVGLLSGLLWQYRNLLLLRNLLDQGVPSEEAFLQGKIRTTKKGKSTYIKGAQRFSRRDLEAGIVLFAEYERRLRGSRTEWQGLLLEMFLYQLFIKKGRREQAFTSLEF